MTLKPLDIRPPTQEQIPETLKGLRQQLLTTQAEAKWIQDRIEAVQNLCTHPHVIKGNTWGRWPYTECKICGKEW
jgi:hypothetical protein